MQHVHLFLLDRLVFQRLRSRRIAIVGTPAILDTLYLHSEAERVFHEVEVVEYLTSLHALRPLASANTIHFGKGTVTGIYQVIDVKPLLSILQASVEGLLSYHCILVDWHSLLVLTVL